MLGQVDLVGADRLEVLEERACGGCGGELSGALSGLYENSAKEMSGWTTAPPCMKNRLKLEK